MPTSRLVRSLVIVGLILGCGAVIWMFANVFDRVSNVLTIIVFSILFSYFIYPMVKGLSRRMPRPLAVATVYVGIFVAVAIALAFFAPTVAAQAADFAQSYPSRVHAVETELKDPSQNPLLQRLPPQARDFVAGNAGKLGTYVGVAATAVGAHVLPIVTGGATLVTQLAIMFGVTFMFIVDLEKIQATLVRMVPRDRREYVVDLVVDIDGVIGGFVRSQVLLSAVTALASIAVLLALGVPYAVIFGLLIGVLGFVPVVGALVGAIPAVIVALFTVGIVKAIVVLVLLAIVFQVIGNLIAPLINAKSVGVTPLIVTLAILIGGEAFGVLGILLSVPIAGIVRVVYDRLFPADPESERLVLSARSRSGDVTQPGERASTTPVAPKLT